VELQLNTTNVPGASARDAILTWNGVMGQAYNQVRNYGKVKLIEGFADRNLSDTRGLKDPTPVTVTFDAAGGTGTFNPVNVRVGSAMGGKFPAKPVKDGYRFLGWFDETVTPNKQYSSSTPVNEALALTAHWEEGSGDIIWDMIAYINDNPPANTLTSSSSTPFGVSSSSAFTPAPEYVEVDGVRTGIRINARANDYHGLNLKCAGFTPPLNCAANIYEVTVKGTVVGTPPAGALMMVTDDQGTVIPQTFSDELTTDAPFEISVELPEALTTMIRIRTNSAGYTPENMQFCITSIVLVDLGPR
jgi:uncharacterized repeat protein (TIGR02543 family)